MSTTLTEIQDKLKGDNVAPGSDTERKLLEQTRALKVPDPAVVSARRAELSSAATSGVVKPEQVRQAGHTAVTNIAEGVAAFEPVAPSNELMPKAPQASQAFEAPAPKPPETPTVPTPPVAA